MPRTDLRELLGDRYVQILRAAVLADNPDAITSAQRVAGKLGEIMYLSAVDRLDRTLAAVLPDLLADARREGQADAWDEGHEVGWDDLAAREAEPDLTDTPNPYRAAHTAAHSAAQGVPASQCGPDAARPADGIVSVAQYGGMDA